MSSADLLLNLNEVSKAGNLVDASKIIEFITDSGKSLGNCVKQVIRGANGTAQTVYTHIAESASGLATSGLSFLTMDVGLLGAALAPVLGVAGGLAIAELISPGTTENVIEAFRDYGLTVGNEVVAYYDTSSGQVSVPEEVINIYKEALLKDDIYSQQIEYINGFDRLTSTNINAELKYFSDCTSVLDSMYKDTLEGFLQNNFSYDSESRYALAREYFDILFAMTKNAAYESMRHLSNIGLVTLKCLEQSFGAIRLEFHAYVINKLPVALRTNTDQYYVKDLNGTRLKTFSSYGDYKIPASNWGSYSSTDIYHYYCGAYMDRYGDFIPLTFTGDTKCYAEKYGSGGTILGNTVGTYRYHGDNMLTLTTVCASLIDITSNAMEGAVLPVKDTPISTTYTGYNPLGLADWVTDIPSLYPIPVVQNPAMTQTQAWNPAYDDSLIDALAEAIVEAIDIPAVITDVIVPPVVVDPDVPAVDIPVDFPIEGTIPLNPADPNLPSQKVPTAMLPTTPFTTESNAMFTVYNPTASQLNELGAFLWSNDILDQIVRIWTNPMEGIISLRKVYATPTCESSSPIQLGNLTTNIISRVLSSQFSTINCGTVKIPEMRKNATDYPPYTKVSIYLPFIGIMDLDTAEVMNSELTLYYHIDMYTGTCLAEIYVKRPDDFVEPQVLYTFTGNCSQTLPLTSQEASGLIGTLTSIATSGMMAAVAPSLAPLSVAGVAGAMSHGQTSVLHSGALSSNAGIMGQRKPYIIVSRQQSYDANNYSELYGFPSNATVYLGNCSGYQKIKAIRLQSEATDEEKREIEALLYEGVIV